MSRQILRKYAKLFDIDYSHFQPASRRPRSDDKIFCLKVGKRDHTVRAIILERNLLPYKCKICGQPPIWLGKQLTLDLDHENRKSIRR